MFEYMVIEHVALKELQAVLTEWGQAGWRYKDYINLGNSHSLLLERQ